MKTKLISKLLGLLLFAHNVSAFAQGTAFTYQGRLNDSASPANGSYDLRFAIYDALVSGSQQGVVLTNSATVVSNGLFTVTLDFGNQFPGANRWLEIGVRSNGVGSFTIVSPRQKFTSSPYAVTAGNVTGTLPAGQISGTLPSSVLGGTYPAALTLNNPANSFSGSGAGLTGVDAATLGGLGSSKFWKIGGNSGTSPGSDFIGTTDNLPLELKVNNQRGLRIEPNDTTLTVNMIGGAACNFVRADVVGATIGGGGTGNFLGNVYSNKVESIFGTISGGAKNTINGSSDVSTISGGFQNTISGNATYATIGGGFGNTIASSGSYSTIGGGSQNTIQSNANFATIPGGTANRAASYGFAAGNRAKADHKGTFVWADSTTADFISSAENQFLIRASGGVGIGMNNPASPLHVSSAGSNPQMRLTQSAPGDFARLRMNVAGSPSWEMDVSSGATPTISWWNIAPRMTLDYDGNLSTVGTVTAAGVLLTSDRAAKENFTAVDGKSVLAKLVALPVTEWNYKKDSGSIRHLGPMAQDFKAAFQLDGADDKHISVVDEGGVALAAIQGLNQKVDSGKENADSRITKLETENEALKQRLEALEKIIHHANSN